LSTTFLKFSIPILIYNSPLFVWLPHSGHTYLIDTWLFG